MSVAIDWMSISAWAGIAPGQAPQSQQPMLPRDLQRGAVHIPPAASTPHNTFANTLYTNGNCNLESQTGHGHCFRSRRTPHRDRMLLRLAR